MCQYHLLINSVNVSMSEKPSLSHCIMKKSTLHLTMQIKEEVPTSINKEVTSEAENDTTLRKDIRINATSGVSQNLAGFVTQNTELKDQLKLYQC